MTPHGGDLDGAATHVALVVLSDKAGPVGERQRDTSRLLETDPKFQGQTCVAVRARETLFEESLNVGGRVTRGRCHRQPLVLACDPSEVEEPRAYMRQMIECYTPFDMSKIKRSIYRARLRVREGRTSGSSLERRPGGVADGVEAEGHDDSDHIELIYRLDRLAAAVAPISIAAFDHWLLGRRRRQAAATRFLDGSVKAISAHGPANIVESSRSRHTQEETLFYIRRSIRPGSASRVAARDSLALPALRDYALGASAVSGGAPQG